MWCDWKERETDNEQGDMRRNLRRRTQPPTQNVGVVVAQQQRRLKKHQAGRPNCRGSTKPRQDHLREQRLKQKQQKCAEGNREGIEKSSESGRAQGHTMNRK